MSWEGPDPQRDEDLANDEEIVAEIEADANMREQSDLAMVPPEIERDDTMSWEGYTEQPILRQMARIAGLSRFARDNFAVVEGIIEEGVPADVLAVEITLDSRDEQVLSYALNLVGFFVPEMGAAAKSLCDKLMAAVDAKEVPDDVKGRIEAAFNQMEERAFAASFGLSIEQYRELVAQEVAAVGDEIVADADRPDPGDAVSPN